MNPAAPMYLWLLAGLCPVLALFLWWSWTRRCRGARLFIRERLLAGLTVGLVPWRHGVKGALLVAGLACVLLALARPRLGFIEQETHATGLDIVVCFDVSRSMLAADLKPNRLTRAKMAAQELATLARSDRLGLVPFAGMAFLQCPLALDSGAFRQSVAALDTEIIPEAGTILADAIEKARSAFGDDSQGTKVILLFTDGEDHEPGAIEAARAAYQDGIRVFTVGVGTAEGDLLRTSDTFGNDVFVRDETGNAVRSRLDENLLREVAERGGGFFVSLQNPDAIQHLYERGLERLPKGTFSGTWMRQWQERFQWPLAAALLLLLAEVLLPEASRRARERAQTAVGASMGLVVARDEGGFHA